MKREKARLEALRAMSYEEYLQTPEWKEVEKAALKRAENRCQVCRAGGVALRVHHATYDNLGCEQEAEVIVLCEGCYDTLAQKMKKAIEKTAVRTDNLDEEVPSVPTVTLGQRALVFAPTALGLDALMLLLHAPPPAEIGGLVAAIVLAAQFPKFYASMRTSLPAPLQEFLDTQAERKRMRVTRGEWSTWDRLLGRHLYDAEPHEAEEAAPAEDEEYPEEFSDYLDLGPTLQPHADRMLSGRKVILGVSGSGKTNTMNVYIEEVGALEPAPAIILFDTDDENRAICNTNKKYWPNPAWMDKTRGLTKESAFNTAQDILEQRYQCVVNLQSYDDEEAAWIMINMIKGVRAWQEAREIRIPCEIVLDEASVWLPQNTRESSLSSIMVEDPDPRTEEDNKKISLLALLQRAFFQTVVRRGRRRGMGFTLAAQRIAEIDKRALQGSWMFLMRQTQPADWGEYKKYGITPEDAMNLLDGEAYVFAPGSTREKHRLRESRSPHGGVTPGMSALRGKQPLKATPAPEAGELVTSATRPQAELPAPSQENALDAVLQLRGKVDEQTFMALLGALTTGTSASAREDAGQQATREATSRPGQDERAGAAATLQRRSSAGLPSEVRAALAVLQPGMTYRDLAVELGYTDGEAREIWQELRKRGLLRAPGQAEITEGRPALYPLPRRNEGEQPAQSEKPKRRTFTSSEIARGFALYQAGYASVRGLESAAKEQGYGWSNGFCRELIDEMAEQKLIQKREKGAV